MIAVSNGNERSFGMSLGHYMRRLRRTA